MMCLWEWFVRLVQIQMTLLCMFCVVMIRAVLRGLVQNILTKIYLNAEHVAYWNLFVVAQNVQGSVTKGMIANSNEHLQQPTVIAGKSASVKH